MSGTIGPARRRHLTFTTTSHTDTLSISAFRAHFSRALSENLKPLGIDGEDVKWVGKATSIGYEVPAGGGGGRTKVFTEFEVYLVLPAEGARGAWKRKWFAIGNKQWSAKEVPDSRDTDARSFFKVPLTQWERDEEDGRARFGPGLGFTLDDLQEGLGEDDSVIVPEDEEVKTPSVGKALARRPRRPVVVDLSSEEYDPAERTVSPVQRGHKRKRVQAPPEYESEEEEKLTLDGVVDEFGDKRRRWTRAEVEAVVLYVLGRSVDSMSAEVIERV